MIMNLNNIIIFNANIKLHLQVIIHTILINKNNNFIN